MPQRPSIACTPSHRYSVSLPVHSHSRHSPYRIVVSSLRHFHLKRLSPSSAQAVAHSVQLAFAREVEDFNTAVGQLAHMPCNQFLGVQSLRVGEGCQRQQLRLRGRRLPSCISARRNRAGGCGLLCLRVQAVGHTHSRTQSSASAAYPFVKSQAQTRFVVVVERATRHHLLAVFGRPHAHFSLVEVGYNPFKQLSGGVGARHASLTPLAFCNASCSRRIASTSGARAS
jgi:hypothetical protein